MTHEEIANEFAEIFADLPDEQINEMLVKNIPFETMTNQGKSSVRNHRVTIFLVVRMASYAECF